MRLRADGRTLEFIKDQYRHCKPILAVGASDQLLTACGIDTDAARRTTGSWRDHHGRRDARRPMRSSRPSPSTGTSHEKPIRRACETRALFTTALRRDDMAEAGTLHDAFIDELRDTYDAEKQLTKALPEIGEGGVGPEAAPGVREPSSRRRRARSHGWNRSSRAWTRRCAASIATGSPASSKKASPSWKKTSMRPRWTPA